MRNLNKLIINLLAYQNLRYLCCGIWNTLFGYTLMLLLYSSLQNSIHIIYIASISTAISVLMSFTTYKYLVFKSTGPYFPELIRSLSVYFSGSIVGIFVTWLLVDVLNFSIYIANALSIIVVAILSYIGHQYHTFKK